ncbi:hypothetical protein P3X46_022390 [Hevea brasiliensis]|uniref:Leucine-rich repeat-containing N-terminal plant-type domain-containing protein n=1 Tax=Hevea brasiliensis TaxID=3981 RepID=A0ABQ9L9I3_HEVBR|nr:hypothetical protein P3X46_022390 [Hevea brasiliensis]
MRVIKQLLVALVIASLLEGWWSCDGCLDDERNALLQLKASFNNPLEISLSSWGIYTDDCCKWENNHCNSTTGRVSQLTIWSNGWYLTDWYFNASLFLPFQELTSLSLLHSFIDCVENEGLSRLENLEFLDLSYNNFNDSIIPSLSVFPSLKSLNLAYNRLESVTNFQGLLNFKNLVYLDLSFSTLHNNFLKDIGKISSLKILLLSGCQLSGTIPAAKGLCELKHLLKLDMSNNDLRGTLPSCLANLTSLQQLDISSNHFIGNISISPLGTLTSLHKLQLSRNLFKIPISLLPFFNHSKLKFLDCHENEIYADIDVPNLTPKFQLETLDLSGQGDGGVFPKFLDYQHKLEYVDLSDIKMKGEFPHWLIGNNTKLYTLHLPSCSLSGPLHLPMHSHVYLSHLDISDNSFNSPIPTEIGVQFPNLYFLNLSGNGLIGDIPSSFGKMSQLIKLDLSNNRLSGIIPQDLIVGCISLFNLILSNNNLQGQIFPEQANCKELDRLLLDGNQFTGSIPYSILNCTLLNMLDVSDNHLFGSIPGWIRNMTFLRVLDISENKFSGTLPSNFVPPQIREVYLSNNRLQGPLTNAFYNCSELMTLDLSRNYFTRRIPDWFGKFPKLSYLLLGYNNLVGEIPIQLCNLGQLSLVDLSNNNLSGHVLPCITAASNKVRQEEVGTNPYMASSPAYMKQPLEFTTKSISYYFQGSILKYISGLDLSCNNLTGKIPTEIGNLSMIQVLNLSHNSLTGLIPQSFSNLKQIESLDLSYNKLNGKIPQLTQLHWLAVFSVAHNNLSGKTPEMVAQFATFDNSSYEGNPFLCGPPLSKSCFSSSIMPRVSEEDKKDHKRDGGFMDMDAFYVSFLISYALVLLTMAAILYINPYWRRAWFYMIELSLTNLYYFLVDNIPFWFRCY